MARIFVAGILIVALGVWHGPAYPTTEPRTIGALPPYHAAAVTIADTQGLEDGASPADAAPGSGGTARRLLQTCALCCWLPLARDAAVLLFQLLPTRPVDNHNTYPIQGSMASLTLGALLVPCCSQTQARPSRPAS